MEIWITGPYCIFLDREHLSRAASKGRSLLGEFEEPVKPGFAPAQPKVPHTWAALGTRFCHGLRHRSVGLQKEEPPYWDLFADILDNDTSPWHRYAREMGINHVMEVYLDTCCPILPKNSACATGIPA